MNFEKLINDIIWFCKKKLANIIFTLNNHFTYLSLVIFILLGSLAIIIWMNFNKKNFNWKKNAIIKVIKYTFTLISIKIVLLLLTGELI